MSSPEVATETLETVRGVRRWLSEQLFANVMLLLLFVTVGFVSLYTVAIAIPAYEEAHRQERASMAKEHKEERKEIAERYERWVNILSGTKTASTDNE